MPRALENLEASIVIQRKIGDKAGLVYSLGNFGRMYLDQQEYTLARKHLLEAESLAVELGDKESMSQSYERLADLCMQTGNLGRARQYILKTIDISGETGSKGGLMWGYFYLTRIDSAEGRYKDALTHYKLHKAYADAIASEQQQEVIAQLEVQYETEKKDHEIKRLESAHQIQALKLKKQTAVRNYLMVGLMLLLLSGYFAFKYFSTRNQLKLQSLRKK